MPLKAVTMRWKNSRKKLKNNKKEIQIFSASQRNVGIEARQKKILQEFLRKNILTLHQRNQGTMVNILYFKDVWVALQITEYLIFIIILGI